MKIASGILIGLMFASGVISAGGATAQQRRPGGPFEDLRGQIEVLENRVEFLEQALSSLQTALAGLVCPEGQFVHGFNASGDLLCAAPELQSEPAPGEPIPLPDLAEALQAEFNELLAQNEFPFEDLFGTITGGSFSLTDLALRLDCSNECVTTLQATSLGDGTTLRVDYGLAGPFEVSGAAEVVIFGSSSRTPFVMTYDDVTVRFFVQINEDDGSVGGILGAILPEPSEIDVLGGQFEFLENLFVSTSKEKLRDFINQFHLQALSALEPIQLPGAEM